MDAATLARAIDHTLLRPDAPAAEVRQLCREAAEHGFVAVCIPPVHVAAAAEILAGTGVRVGTVVAFPLGYAHPEVRRAESLRALADGAVELDTVLDVSWLKGGEDAKVLDDLSAWVEAARAAGEGLTLKVIVETALLSDPEKRRAARLVVECGADFVKTSTGFAGVAKSGATVADVRLLADEVAAAAAEIGGIAGRIGVKASGGIRDLNLALALLAAGATRLGTSSGVALVSALAAAPGPHPLP
jgi:deoxyribose-phosphate aldolase